MNFYRLSGAGNDFIALVEPPAPPAPATLSAWCARGISLGADGVFLLSREGDAARMIHFNPDGGRAELCLNGTRCAARLALHLGWAKAGLDILTDAGPVAARALADGRVELALAAPRQPPQRLELGGIDGITEGWAIEIGVPHLVVEWPRSLADAPVDRLGAELRSHPALGAAGANVDFVRFVEPHRLELRTFERGVEAETLACGTGVLAAAAVGVARGLATPPVEALTRGGFTLRVSADWALAGDARLIGEGTIHDGAVEAPPPARWS